LQIDRSGGAECGRDGVHADHRRAVVAEQEGNPDNAVLLAETIVLLLSPLI
jgi:hypothetical protein